MQSTKIYIIKGTTGEYSDWQQWIVSKVFYSRENAEALASELDRLGKFGERAGTGTFEEWYNTRASILKKLQTLDPKAKLDYTGTSYSVQECDLF
jgi:hypothetical protein